MEEVGRVPFWEELVHTPMFFGKSAEGIESKELGGNSVVYGKWKSVQAYENKGGIFRGKSRDKHSDRGGYREHRGSARPNRRACLRSQATAGRLEGTAAGNHAGG